MLELRMVFKTVLLFLLSYNLYASENIHQKYFIDSRSINSSLFFKEQKNIKLYEIPSHKSSVRFKKEQLEKLLKENGFKDFKIDSRYVYFEMNSPIDTSNIEYFLKKHYKEKYKQIDIKNISVRPRSFMDTLPKSYTIDIRDRYYLGNEGVISIEDSNNKRYYFDYKVDAELDVVVPTKKISRREEISKFNSKIKKVRLDKFRARPLQKIYNAKHQAKYNLNIDQEITYRDIQKLSLVKRDTQVSVFLNSSAMSISFGAKALQSGKLNDIITVQKSDGTRLKARVVAKQRVEIR